MKKAVLCRLSVALLMLLLFACSQETTSKGEAVARPEFVYVPAGNYKISVEIAVPREAVVGEWITLRATRTSGPWKLSNPQSRAQHHLVHKIPA
jgi:hypothetical protein